WRAAGMPDDVIQQRLLDAPLSFYLPGLGRLLTGQTQSLPHDWDWSMKWAGNVALGALPAADLLNAGRWPSTALTVLALLPLYGLGTRIGGGQGWRGAWTGLAAALLYALSGLVLLHGRRAESEGPLLFLTLAAVWALLRWPRQPLPAAALAA